MRFDASGGIQTFSWWIVFWDFETFLQYLSPRMYIYIVCAKVYCFTVDFVKANVGEKTDYCAKNVSRTDRLVFIAQSDKSSLLLSILRLKV